MANGWLRFTILAGANGLLWTVKKPRNAQIRTRIPVRSSVPRIAFGMKENPHDRPRRSQRGGRLWLTLRQAKTKELVDVPAHRDLEAMLRAAERRSLMVVPSPTGKQWSYRNFSRSWDKARQAAGVDGVQRRDLRRTAMVRMAEAGATTAQIAAVSGHTIDQTARILDTYIPRRGEVAAGAIEAWEAGQARSVVVPIAAAEVTNNRQLTNRQPAKLLKSGAP